MTAASGISAMNVSELIARTGVSEVHVASAVHRKLAPSSAGGCRAVRIGADCSGDSWRQVDPELVKELVRLIRLAPHA